MATSVPVPMASPRSAWASAAASLTPSPTMATARPSACSRLTDVDLVRGQYLGDDLGDPDLGGDRAGSGLVVAGQQDRRQPERAEPLDRLGAGVLQRVRDDQHGAGRPSQPTTTGRAAGALGIGLRALQVLRQRQAALGQQRRAAHEHVPAVDDALDAEAFEVAEAGHGRQRAELAFGGGATARAIGCSDAASSAPAYRSASARSSPVTTSTRVIRPVVTVPVLSSTIVSITRVVILHMLYPATL